MQHTIHLASVLPFLLLAPTLPAQESKRAAFRDISEASGIRAENILEGSPVKVPINDHSRLGFVDLDGDGFDDIVCHSLYPNPLKGVPFEHLVYRNRGDGTFEHVSDASGLRHVQAGFLAFGDVDNDGDQDCFAGLDVPLRKQTHQILLNDGAGHFTPKAKSGVEDLPPRAGNAVFADFDGDGKLDLFVGMGHTSAATENALLMGRGDGRFRDASKNLKGNLAQPSNGSISCDYDGDGDMDILVSNYGVSVLAGQNALFENNGRGRFKNVAEEAGFAAQASGNSWLVQHGELEGEEPKPGRSGPISSNGFGLDCGDINGDGVMDVFITAISHPVKRDYKRSWSDPTLLLIGEESKKGLRLVDETVARGIPFNEGDVDGAMVDFDNDGLLDLSISRDRKYERAYSGVEQKAWFGLLRQQPDGTFESIGHVSGINDLAEPAAAPEGEPAPKNLWPMKNAQNHGWSDIDGDGDLDLLVGGRDLGGGRPNFLLRNEAGSEQGWLRLLLAGDGKKVNRDAIGARLWLDWGPNTTSMREVKSSRGNYNSMDTRWQHFGLGESEADLTLRVRWPDGLEVELGPELLEARKSYSLAYPDRLTLFEPSE